jgi:hypothetical protein
LQKSEKSEGQASDTEEVLKVDFNTEVTEATENGSGNEDWGECEWEELLGG